MVIGHDRVHAQVRKFVDDIHRAGAIVHANYQGCADLLDLADRVLAEGVTVLLAIGDVPLDPCFEDAQEAHEDRGPRDSVHVIVPVNQNHLVAFHRLLQAFDCLFHLGQALRIVEELGDRLQEAAGGFARFVPTVHQQLG